MKPPEQKVIILNLLIHFTLLVLQLQKECHYTWVNNPTIFIRKYTYKWGGVGLKIAPKAQALRTFAGGS